MFGFLFTFDAETLTSIFFLEEEEEVEKDALLASCLPSVVDCANMIIQTLSRCYRCACINKGEREFALRVTRRETFLTAACLLSVKKP
jgi:hypothetical protein